MARYITDSRLQRAIGRLRGYRPASESWARVVQGVVRVGTTRRLDERVRVGAIHQPETVIPGVS